MSVHLYFSNNSIRDTTVTCDSLGIHYNVSKSGRIISLSRWDSTTGSDVLVGQFELPFMSKDKVRIGPNGQWQPLNKYIDGGGHFSTTMSFTSNNGMKYSWKTNWGKLIMTHQGSDETLIRYHRNVSSPSYLEVSDSSTMSGLDNILLTFLIAERKRRNRQKRRRTAAASGGGGGGGGGGS